ncbi:MAG TPA: iron-containing redox enzyme family protein [Solirubrobacterales bacterium]|nr:iron-containing redox enzyme family protein [Solirubrobacterales bacterium]
MNESTWQRIERSRERWDVLRHPFYVRWSNGELSADELAFYSGQYRHAVEAIATMSTAAADALPEREELRRHAAEELGHVRLWDGFVAASGGETTAEATSETAVCVREWTADGEPAEILARLYAIESSQPAISRTKLEGLRGPYGYDEGAGTAYFSVHESRDVEHAAEVRELIEGLEEVDEDALVAAAEAAYRANWRLLDGV